MQARDLQRIVIDVRRRAIFVGAATAALAWPLVARAQPRRIGFLSPTTPNGSALVLGGLRQGLREQGYVEGTSITIEYRYANFQFDRLPELARELIALPVDLLVTFVTQARRSWA
jgi:putative ABC transport system substrate-binding protein